jgi:hypothetical protein
MLNKLKQSIENIIYNYDANEFMPVWYDGKLDNRNEFVAYKLRRLSLWLLASSRKMQSITKYAQSLQNS